MTCSGTQAALLAAQESPRCQQCDRFLPEHREGAPICPACPHYILHGTTNAGCDIVRIEFTLAADRERAASLMRGVNGRAEWHVTPARCRKWAALYDAGWLYDARGFYCAGSVHRWPMRDALKIVEDMQ